MLRCSISDDGKDIYIDASGSFEAVAASVAQIVRVLYRQIRESNEDAGQFFKDGFIRMINDEKIWNTDSLIPNHNVESMVIFAEQQ